MMFVTCYYLAVPKLDAYKCVNSIFDFFLEKSIVIMRQHIIGYGVPVQYWCVAFGLI